MSDALTDGYRMARAINRHEKQVSTWPIRKLKIEVEIDVCVDPRIMEDFDNTNFEDTLTNNLILVGNTYHDAVFRTPKINKIKLLKKHFKSLNEQDGQE